MRAIDTHCHASPYWFEPMEILRHQMTLNSVEKALLVQFFGVYDNEYLITQQENASDTFRVVGLVDTDREDALVQLNKLRERGVLGIRFTATTRSPGPDPLLIWREAESLGMTASVMGACEDYAAKHFENIVRECSALPIVIEHLGGVGAFFGPGRSSSDIPYQVFSKVLALSQFDNVAMKLTGLGEFCKRPRPLPQPMPFVDVPPVIDLALESFGVDRLMWGSDYPPVSAREGYKNSLLFPYELINLSNSEKDKLFYQNAIHYWNF